jgi:hypothetical protein
VAEVGLSARTREKGALLERWRAQCGDWINYTADPRIRACAAKEIVLASRRSIVEPHGLADCCGRIEILS